MVSETKQASLAIMFADISDSTKLYDKLGDKAARAITSKCLDLMFGKVEDFDGTVIKTIGDEVMCTFPTADQCVAAATAMHTGVSDELQTADIHVTIRIGLHYGPVIHERGDVFGDAVNVAARMAGRAKAEQIVTTTDTVDALSAKWQDATRHIDTMPVKGKAADVKIHEVIWQPEDMTEFATQFVRKIPAATTSARLSLSFGGSEVEMTQANDKAILGRDKNATLTVDTRKASRQHLSIECLRGKFVLRDQSTNGTYVTNAGREIYLRSGESLMLTGEGKISLGQEFDENPDVVIYNCQA